MNLRELKDSISKGTLGSPLLVFVWEGDCFLAKQYAEAIAKMRGQEIQYLSSFKEMVSLSENENVFGDDFGDNILKVLKVDAFDEIADEGIRNVENSIVICGKISKDSEDSFVKIGDFIVRFPKAEAWQAKDYMRQMAKGLSKGSVDMIYESVGGDLFRIENELVKISCFPEDKQEAVLRDMVRSGAFDDVSKLTIFNLTNAIVKRDLQTVAEALSRLGSMDVDAIGLSTILHRNIKNIIDIQMNSKATPESLGMSVKQFKAIEYSCNKIRNEKLIEFLKFLDEFDFKLKSGCLDIPNGSKIDYIACKLLER